MSEKNGTANPSVFPLLLLGLLILFALLLGGLWAALAVAGAFAVGRSSVHGNSPLFQSLEQKRAGARGVLERLPVADVERIEAIVSEGRTIEAIKEIRAVNNDGLMEAKNAAELLAERGLAWRDEAGTN